MKYFAFLLCSVAAAAEDPRIGGPTTYATPSRNGEYLFVMIAPRSTTHDTEKDASAKEIYEKYKDSGSGMYKDGTKQWGVDWYSYRVWVADDGNHIVRLYGDFPLSERFPASRRLPEETVADQVNGPALGFFNKDQLLKIYTVREMVKNIEGLPHSLHHVLWSADGVITQDDKYFNMGTQEPRQVIFELETGNIKSDRAAGLGNADFWAVRIGMAAVLVCGLIIGGGWMYRAWKPPA